MATSSSAKKAAQVAARSNAASSKRTNWLFPAAIAAIVVLGIAVVWFAREENVGVGDNDTPPLAQLAQGSAFDHWHSAFSVNVCGTELGPYSDNTADVLGIHAHPGEALIHVHPFSLRSAGENAVMGHFFDQVGLEVTDTGFKVPEGDVYSETETTCGGEPAELTLSYWKTPLEATSAEPDEIITEDFGSVRFTEDQSAYALALLPKGDVPDMPAGIRDLVNPSDLAPQGGEAPIPEPGELTDTPPGDTTVVVPGEETDPSAPEGAEDPAGDAPAGDDPAGEDPAGEAPADAGTETTAGSPG